MGSDALPVGNPPATRRPLCVTVIGVVFILGGMIATWNVVEGALSGTIHLNFAAFLLPTGIGLLRFRESSRRWAIFWLVLGYIIMAAVLIAGLVLPGAAYARIGDRELTGAPRAVLLFAAWAILVGLLGWAHRALTRPQVKRCFSRPIARPPDDPWDTDWYDHSSTL